MFEDIELNAIQEENARELVKRLLNMVEQLSREVRELRVENQRLRDENNRLKGIKQHCQRQITHQRQSGTKNE